MAPGTLGVVFKSRKPFFGMACIPPIEGLSGYTELSKYPSYIADLIVSFERSQPLAGSSLYDILVHAGDLLCVGFGFIPPLSCQSVNHADLSGLPPPSSLYPHCIPCIIIFLAPKDTVLLTFSIGSIM
jgi:hypothetical protein